MTSFVYTETVTISWMGLCSGLISAAVTVVLAAAAAAVAVLAAAFDQTDGGKGTKYPGWLLPVET